MASYLVCTSTLLIQSTRAGKSSLPLRAAVVNRSVIIILENILALGSDQRSKVFKDSNLSTKYIKSFQLYLFRSKEDKTYLSATITSHLSSNINTSILLFSSPETILEKEQVVLIEKLVLIKRMKLFYIDEVH